MGKRKKFKKISRGAKKTFRVLNSIDKTAEKFVPLNQKIDSHKISDTGTEEIKLINQQRRTIKQAVRTEASLIRLRILLIKRLLEIRKKRKLRLKIKKTKGKKYTIVKTEYKAVRKKSSLNHKEKKLNKSVKGKYRLKSRTVTVNKHKVVISKKNSVKKKRLFKFSKKKAAGKKNNKPKKLTKATKNLVSEAGRLSSEVLSQQRQTDKNSITDTGSESVKLMNSTVHTGKNAIKTAKKTVKTTKNTVKTVKNIPKNVKRTVKTTYRVTKAVVKTAIKVGKAAVKVISKIIAVLIENPVILLIIIIVFIVMYIIYACVTVLGGGAAGSSVTRQEFQEAGGLENVPENLKDAFKLLEECKSEKKKAYEQWIDQMYYDSNNDNLKKSDLVYMERFDKDDKKTTYEKGFASTGQKQILKDAFDWSLGVDDIEILSMVYVVAEIEANDINSDTYQIKEIKYTKELINRVLDKIVLYQDSHIDERQECPDKNCTKKSERNPEWDRAYHAQEKLLNGYNEWVNNIIPELQEYSKLPGTAQSAYWEYNIKWRLENWSIVYENDDVYGSYYPYTDNNGIDFCKVLYQAYSDWWDYWQSGIPEYIITFFCVREHKLYSKGLEFFKKDEITSLLGFNDIEQLWFEYTEEYFRLITSSAS